MEIVSDIPFSSSSSSFMPATFGNPSSFVNSIPYLFGFGPMLRALLQNPWFLESFRFLILGSIIETGRRLWQWVLNNAKSGIFVTAYFAESDMAHEWLEHYSRAQPRNNLEFKVTATYDDDSNPRSIDETKPVQAEAEVKPTIAFDFSTNSSQFYRFQGTWVHVESAASRQKYSRWSLGAGDEIPAGTTRVTLYTRRKEVLEKLVEAARQYHAKTMSKPKIIPKPDPYSSQSEPQKSIPCLTATFNHGDLAYSWVKEYLDSHHAWSDSRNLIVKAKTTGIKRGIDLGQYHYEPGQEAPHLFRFKDVWVQVTRDRGTYNYSSCKEEDGPLTFIFHTLRRQLLDEFVELARSEYGDKAVGHVTVHLASYGSWGKTITKPRRPFDSIILDNDVKEMLLSDANQFYESEEWYASAGIPHKRGYLLYGPPGTGKSSTVHALAGELGLQIYVLSLSNPGLDDRSLQDVVASTSMNAILLIEDIDCAFPNRDNQPVDVPSREGERRKDRKDGSRDENEERKQYSRVTLSGLLNVLDSVTSVEGRLLFATTNYIDELDEALIRPGRIDVKVQFKLASKNQVRKLFERFYPPTPPRSLIHNQSPERVLELAERFSAVIPEDKYSVAQIQGFLLTKKSDPEGAVSDVRSWMDGLEVEKVEKEARMKARMMKIAEKKIAEREAEKAAEDELAKRLAAQSEGVAVEPKGKEDEECLEDKEEAGPDTTPPVLVKLNCMG